MSLLKELDIAILEYKPPMDIIYIICTYLRKHCDEHNKESWNATGDSRMIAAQCLEEILRVEAR